jgi:hypothetical protein
MKKELTSSSPPEPLAGLLAVTPSAWIVQFGRTLISCINNENSTFSPGPLVFPKNLIWGAKTQKNKNLMFKYE